MLVSLRASLHEDMMACVINFKAEVQELGGRMNNIIWVNLHLPTTHPNKCTQWPGWWAGKTQSYSRRHWGLLKAEQCETQRCSESVQNAQLNQYAYDLIHTVLPSTPTSEMVIRRIHRLPKPFYLPDNVPKDVIMRVHFYHVKDKLMSNFRKTSQSNSPAFNGSLPIYATKK